LRSQLKPTRLHEFRGDSNRPDVTRSFPYNALDKVEAYVKELRSQRFRPEAKQGDDTWEVRVRDKGYPQQNITCPSRKEAEALVKKLDAERSPPSSFSTTPFAKRWRIIDSTARSGEAGRNPVVPTESPPTFGLLVGGAVSSGTLVLAICTY
jgi:hypothetical protein